MLIPKMPGFVSNLLAATGFVVKLLPEVRPCNCPAYGGLDEPGLPLLKSCDRVIVVVKRVAGRSRLESWEGWSRLRAAVRLN